MRFVKSKYTVIFSSLLMIAIAAVFGWEMIESKATGDINDVASWEMEQSERFDARDQAATDVQSRLGDLEVNEQGVEDFISNTHQYMNETVGYGKIDKYKQSYSHQGPTKNQEYDDLWFVFLGYGQPTGEMGMYPELLYRMDALLPIIENEHLKEDLNNVKELLRYVKAGRSADGLAQIHRVFHDLDYYYVRDKKPETIGKDYFEVTRTVSNTNHLETYLDVNFVSRDLMYSAEESKVEEIHTEDGGKISIEEYRERYPKSIYTAL